MTAVLCSAIIIGICMGLFGSGGSILTIPVLLYLLHITPEQAIPSSLLIVGLISLFNSARHLHHQRISWPHLLWFGLPGMAGTYAGSWIGTKAGSDWQLLIFSILMSLAAMLMWRNHTSNKTPPRDIHIISLALNGMMVGILTGFVGVGGGFLIVPALVLLGGMSLPTATATSIAIISLQALTGFGSYYLQSQLNMTPLQLQWSIILPMVTAGIVGSYIGIRLSTYLPVLILQRSFAIFLLLMSVIVIYRSVL